MFCGVNVDVNRNKNIAINLFSRMENHYKYLDDCDPETDPIERKIKIKAENESGGVDIGYDASGTYMNWRNCEVGDTKIFLELSNKITDISADAPSDIVLNSDCFRFKCEDDTTTNQNIFCDFPTVREKKAVEVKIETYMNVDKFESMESSDLTSEVDIKNEIVETKDQNFMLNSAEKYEVWKEEQQGLHETDNSMVDIDKQFSAASSSSYKLSTCVQCDKTFKSKVLLHDHTIKKHPEYISCISSKIHGCKCCTYKTTRKDLLAKHMLKHPEAADSYKLYTCIHCKAAFKSKVMLADHTIRKHPDYISSVTNKIHKCTKCRFKTVMKYNFDRHMLKHPETTSSFNFSNCKHCNATFTSKISLDDHQVKKHPDFIASVTSKIHHCTICTYKTTIKRRLVEHRLKHPGTAGTYKLITCKHCDAAFKSKSMLDDHTIRKHPDFIASVTNKIHQCTNCTFKTTFKSRLDVHNLKHPETADSYKLKTCIHCNATFRSKATLDDHTVKKHPDYIASVSNKIHECTECTYKTVMKSHLIDHMSTHLETFKSKLGDHSIEKLTSFIAETARRYKINNCKYCSATFKSKTALDNHTIKKHPDCIASVSTKIHECTICVYKTTKKSDLNRHLFKHAETASLTQL